MIESFSQGLIEGLVVFATDLLIPTMIVAFIFAAIFRILIFLNMKREQWFSYEFAKRVNAYIEKEHHNEQGSFFLTAKILLEKTFYELFIVRSIMMRRKADYVTSLMDRIFLIQQGSARVVRDSLKQLRNLRHAPGHQPNFTEIDYKSAQNC